MDGVIHPVLRGIFRLAGFQTVDYRDSCLKAEFFPLGHKAGISFLRVVYHKGCRSVNGQEGEPHMGLPFRMFCSSYLCAFRCLPGTFGRVRAECVQDMPEHRIARDSQCDGELATKQFLGTLPVVFIDPPPGSSGKLF